MVTPFKKAFYGNIPDTIPPSTIKKQLQWYLFLRLLILTILLGISVILQTKSHKLSIPNISYTAYFVAGLYFFTIVSALFLKVVENYKQFALIQTVGDAILVGVIVYATGCSQSIFTILYFLPILTGSFLLLRLGGLLIASVATMSYGFVLLVELLYNPVPLINKASSLESVIVAMHYFAIHGVIFFIIGILSFIIFERMHTTESALSQTTLNYDRLEILYRQIFADITTGIITIDDGGKITSFNQAAEKISGYRQDEVYGRNFFDFFPGLANAGQHSYQQTTELKKKDGSTIPIGFMVAKLNMPGEYGDCRAFTIQDQSIIKDMEKQIKQSEKLATIGEMAAGIAHEFRNPLAAISGSAQILQSELAENSSSRRLIDIVTRETDRLDHTVGEFLMFSKPADPIKEWFSLKPAIADAIQMLEQGKILNHDNCKITINVPTGLEIWGDSKQIKRIFMNLLTNSCQFIDDENGEIIIEAGERKNKSLGKDEIVIKFSDNGSGIDDQDLANIFEPFFTTRESGTGLGLAIVSQLVDSHGGRIFVSSKKEELTEFIITLPLP